MGQEPLHRLLHLDVFLNIIKVFNIFVHMDFMRRVVFLMKNFFTVAVLWCVLYLPLGANETDYYQEACQYYDHITHKNRDLPMLEFINIVYNDIERTRGRFKDEEKQVRFVGIFFATLYTGLMHGINPNAAHEDRERLSFLVKKVRTPRGSLRCDPIIRNMAVSLGSKISTGLAKAQVEACMEFYYGHDIYEKLFCFCENKHISYADYQQQRSVIPLISPLLLHNWSLLVQQEEGHDLIKALISPLLEEKKIKASTQPPCSGLQAVKDSDDKKQDEPKTTEVREKQPTGCDSQNQSSPIQDPQFFPPQQFDLFKDLVSDLNQLLPDSDAIVDFLVPGLQDVQKNDQDDYVQQLMERYKLYSQGQLPSREVDLQFLKKESQFQAFLSKGKQERADYVLQKEEKGRLYLISKLGSKDKVDSFFRRYKYGTWEFEQEKERAQKEGYTQKVEEDHNRTVEFARWAGRDSTYMDFFCNVDHFQLLKEVWNASSFEKWHRPYEDQLASLLLDFQKTLLKEKPTIPRLNILKPMYEKIHEQWSAEIPNVFNCKPEEGEYKFKGLYLTQVEAPQDGLDFDPKEAAGVYLQNCLDTRFLIKLDPLTLTPIETIPQDFVGMWYLLPTWNGWGTVVAEYPEIIPALKELAVQ